MVVRQEEAVVLWFVVGLAFAFGLLPRPRIGREALVPLAGIALLAAWTTFSLTWTESSERTFNEIGRVLHLGGLALLGLSLVDRTTWRPAAAGLATGAIGITGLAVLSRIWPGPFPANAVGRALVTDRLNYPFNYWNALGAWSAMSVAMALAWSVEARSLATRGLCAAVLPVCGTAIYLTYSRSAVIGGCLAVVLVVALTRNRWMALVHALAGGATLALTIHVIRTHKAIAHATSGAGGGSVALALILGAVICATVAVTTWVAGGERWRVRPPLGRIGVAALVVAGMIVAATAGNHAVRKGWNEFRSGDNPTIVAADPAARLTSFEGSRYKEWKSAVRAFHKKPVEGLGAGTFEFWWNRDDGRGFVRNAHSLYLETLAELGFPGLLFVLLFVGGLGVLALRALLTSADPLEHGGLVAPTAALLVFLFHAGVDWMWQSTAVAVLAILSATVALGSRNPPASGPRRTLRIAVPILAVVAILVQLPGLLSVSDVRDSQALAAAGKLAQARGKANDAIDAEPWSGSAYSQRALVEEVQGSYGSAARDLRKAASKETTNWRPWLLLARVEAERGRVRQSLSAYRHAKRLHPTSYFFVQPTAPFSQ